MSDADRIIKATAEACHAARVYGCVIEVDIKRRFSSSVHMKILPSGAAQVEVGSPQGEPTQILPSSKYETDTEPR